MEINQTKNLKLRRADNFVTFPVICDFSLTHWSDPEELSWNKRIINQKLKQINLNR